MIRLCRSLGVAVLIVASAVAAHASLWAGHYGTIHLAFNEGPEFEHILNSEPLPRVGAIVDLYVCLEIDGEATYRKEAFLSVGGYELQLAVEGAEWEILSLELPERSVNVGVEKGTLYVGKYNGIEFVDGVASLAHWRLQIKGDPENVVFRLNPEGIHTCNEIEDCPGTGTQAIWTGSGAARQVGIVFSAGYVPAYLNWSGEEAPDLEPVRGEVDWHERDMFKDE